MCKIKLRKIIYKKGLIHFLARINTSGNLYSGEKRKKYSLFKITCLLIQIIHLLLQMKEINTCETVYINHRQDLSYRR